MTVPSGNDDGGLPGGAPTGQKEPISRNHLALVRTDLANERTLLAYGRTAIMLAATAVTIVKFFPELPNVMAYGLAIAGVALSVALVGVLRYLSLRRRIRC